MSMGNKKYKLKAYLTPEEKTKCHAIIHGASVASGGVGAGLAQIPLADNAVITPIQIGMIVALGKVFEQEITKSAAQAILSGLAANAVGRGAAQVLVGWVPGIGNAINSATAAALTETIGWMAVDRFAKDAHEKTTSNSAGESDTESSNFDFEADQPYENAEEQVVERNSPRIDLTIRANEFLNGYKNIISNKEDYRNLCEDFRSFLNDNELDEDDELFNLYDKIRDLN